MEPQANFTDEVFQQQRGKEMALFVKELALESRFAYTLTLTNPKEPEMAETLVGFRDHLSVRFYNDGICRKIFRLHSVSEVSAYLINAVARGYDFRQGGCA